MSLFPCEFPSSHSRPTRETMRHANALSCNGKPPVRCREKLYCPLMSRRDKHEPQLSYAQFLIDSHSSSARDWHSRFRYRETDAGNSFRIERGDVCEGSAACSPLWNRSSAFFRVAARQASARNALAASTYRDMTRLLPLSPLNLCGNLSKLVPTKSSATARSYCSREPA